ncbi:uncharacterized protein LOC123547726 [Mercenaria mercenaria]|uniref:uncharacterized protein LOC123547726 n=1 Tax=Mercenaria mercenaria TaxID=6596 RepID=UPI00234EDC1E|nr:uncharacterized protein LOC123547726 [Mercenaria mercenaria]
MNVHTYIKILCIVLINLTFILCYEKFFFSKQLVTELINRNILNTLTKVRIQTCIERCKESLSCEVIKYRRRYHLCILLEADSMNNLDIHLVHGEVYSSKSTWDMTEYLGCQHCREKHACARNGSSCYAAACGSPPYIQSSSTRGNMFSIGDRIAFECENTSDKAISECQQDGTWNLTGIQCNNTDNLSVMVITGSVWTSCQGSTYMFVRTELTWINAKINCEAQASQLVKVDSLQIDTCIQDIFNSLYSGERVNLWIGANDIATEGIFEWADGSSVSGYDSWNNRQPDNALGNEDCAVLGTRFFRWNDNDCSDTHGSICSVAAP